MKVIVDNYHLYKTTSNDFVVSDQRTYQEARKLLFNYLVDGSIEFENLHVFEQPFVDWFNDIPELVNAVTPRKIISLKYPGQRIPDDLTDDDIYSLGLIELPFPPTEKNIFGHFFGMELPQDNISFALVYMLAQCVFEKKNCFENSYLNRLWESTLKGLINTDASVLNELLIPLIDLDTEHAEIVSEGIYCCKNIPYIERWLHEHTRYFYDCGILIKSLEQLLKSSQSIEQTNARLEKNIYRFVVHRFESGDGDVSEISGYYAAEAEALIYLRPRLLLDDYQLLSEKFAGRLNYSQQQGLFKLCSPEYVQPPVITGSNNIKQQMEVWQKWAIDSFIPYKFYYDESAEVKETVMQNIEKGSVAYSDWLFANYRFIRTSGGILTNFDVPTLIRNQIENSEIRVIWLILDGFPAYYTPALKGILQKNGLNQIDLQWSLATLPTITSLGIPLMLSGGYEVESTPGSLTNRQAILNNTFNGKICFYTSKLKEFQRALALETDLCCLHTHEIDDMLHQNDSMFDTSRSDKIEEILEKRIKVISDIIKETAGKKVKLIISTDHGATKCFNKGQNIKNGRLEEAMKDNVRERCVALTGSLSNEQFDSDDIYLLKKEVSQNRDDWAIAKGYKYFGRHDTGYRHGGLSPEETIVPLLCCEIRLTAEPELQIRYIGLKDLKFGKTERDFKLKIRNAGSTAIVLQELSIIEDKNCVFTLPATIAPGAAIVLQAPIKLPQKLQDNAKGGKLDLHLTASCLLLGEYVIQQLKCTVMTEKDEFEDDFDF